MESNDYGPMFEKALEEVWQDVERRWNIASLELVQEARAIGRTRQDENVMASRKDLLHTGQLSSAASHALGAFGELVVERMLGLKINKRTGGPSRAPDVGEIEVKTRWKRGSILVPIEDQNRYRRDQVFVLVHANPPFFIVPGWAYAFDFIGPEFKPNMALPHPAFEITPVNLRPWPPPAPEEMP